MTEADPEPPAAGPDRLGPPRLARVRALVVDVEPLRLDIDFRRLWIGQSVNRIGSQITRVALPYQVYVLTESTLALAALVFVQLVPILLFSLAGGAIADAFDRRRILIAVQVSLVASTIGLVLVSLQPDPAIPLLFALAFVAAGLSSVDQPARVAAITRLVPAVRLRPALALMQLSGNAASIVGPAIAGVLLGTAGVVGAYSTDVVTFGVSVAMLLRMRPIPPTGTPQPPSLESIREGLRFVRGRRLILSTFAIDLNAMFFGSPLTLLPVLALDVFKVGPVGLGLLSAAPAAGALLATVFSGGITRMRRVGRGIVLAVVAWGAAILLFGLSTFAFPLALVFLAIAGGADVISAVLRNSVVQTAAPDELRGRVAAIHVLVVTGGPRLGDIEAALVASVIGAQLSVISGGLLCLAGVLLVMRRFPELDAHVAPGASTSPAAAAGGSG